MISLTNKICGKKFYRLTAIKFVKTSHENGTIWEFICDCGNKKQIRLRSVTSGVTKSCGCLPRVKPKHGMYKTDEYLIWRSMKQRCLNIKHVAYPHYGARGIRICDMWIKSFDSFYQDMGSRPSKKHSIDRIDNEKGYCKENCRWATKSEQGANKRNTIKVLQNGQLYTVRDLYDKNKLKIGYAQFATRIKRGWSIEKAINTPKKEYKKCSV
jgi:hypothetical protein